jgi:hypothetical protein
MTNALADAIAFTTNSAAQALNLCSWRPLPLRMQHCLPIKFRPIDAAPSIYKQRVYFQAFPAATANARKYVMLITNTQNVLIYELEDKIRDDLINLNVPNNSSP